MDLGSISLPGLMIWLHRVHEYFYDILQGAQPGYRSFSHFQPGKYTKADHYIALIKLSILLQGDPFSS
jgi:hypothetical protein